VPSSSSPFPAAPLLHHISITAALHLTGHLPALPPPSKPKESPCFLSSQ
jgi:hypothetical protein